LKEGCAVFQKMERFRLTAAHGLRGNRNIKIKASRNNEKSGIELETRLKRGDERLGVKLEIS